jgi:hypothetical protein
MNRSWITALTLAAVAGSGAAFTGVIANSNDTHAIAASPTLFNQPEALAAAPQAPAPQITSYQVGAAGIATLASNNGSLTIDTAVANGGWTVSGTSGPGTHVDVQFTDGTQLVTFGAELVGTEVVVSLTNVSAAPVTIAPAPAEVMQASVAETTEPTFTAPITPRPATHTTARAVPAPSGESNDDSNDDHETEPNDD